MTDNEYVQFSVKKDTRQDFKVLAVQAGLTYDEYLRYLLNLGKAYPPTQDYKWAQEQQATDEH